ncbi:MAG: IS30 family transposase [Actinomycetota bacterium]
MAGRRLCLQERVWIEVGIGRGESDEEIAVGLGRHRSTIWREVTAVAGADRLGYRAADAQRQAGRNARRPKTPKLSAHPGLAEKVASKLAARWSPHAIAAWLQRVGEKVRVCAETIYRAVYANTIGWGLEAGCWRLLPSARRRRRHRSRVEQARRANQLGNIRSVHTRPAGAGDRSEAGHWEGDLIMGAANRSAVVTLAERVSRLVLVGDLPEGHGAESTLACLLECFDQVPSHLRRSLTWDQGREMTEWQQLEDGIGIPVYFCDPHSPWQRPTNENTNRQLRRWLPKGIDLAQTPVARLLEITHNLNTMPRRLHQWASAADRYHDLCRDHQ